MTPVRNVAAPEGKALGQQLARLCDAAEPAARQLAPHLPPRCRSCAFRAGNHIPNGSPQTLMDALKCVIERVRFDCHEKGRVGQPCSGWAILAVTGEGEPTLAAPWPFSEEAHDAQP